MLSSFSLKSYTGMALQEMIIWMLFVVAFTHHLHFSDRQSLITLVEGGLAAVDWPQDVETHSGKTLH